MNLQRLVGASSKILQVFLNPRLSFRLLRQLPITLRGLLYSHNWQASASIHDSSSGSANEAATEPSNPLKTYFASHKEGRGILKWTQYFDIYHRHFSKFVGREVHVLEIGIYSGGSLEMWKHYFGPKCHVYGVDIEEACKAYEADRIKVFVGDQADREFWKLFKKQVPTIDLLIDDGGHHPMQQIVTFEEMLPHLRPGGVYLCEDIHEVSNAFSAYMHGVADNLNASSWTYNAPNKGIQSVINLTPFQKAIHSIHLYPFITVIEKAHQTHQDQFSALKHGTEWQPWL
jgi:hypothetical protein